jgi:Holliday junction resolvase RusA-like endonuclease
MRIELNVHGIPKPQPRQRHRISKRRGGGPQFVQNYTPRNDKVQDWKSAIKQRALFDEVAFRRISGPISLSVMFFMPIPKSLQKKVSELDPHIKVPDTDNLAKAVMDALTDCGVWEDDKQVYRSSFSKVYSSDPGAKIVIEYQEEA